MPEVVMDFIPSDEEEEVLDNVTESEEDDPPSDIEEPIKSAIVEPKHPKEDLNINDIFENNTPVKLTKKGVPRKKRPPMTEEHKEKLAKAREKAMIARQVNAKERKAVKALDIEEKELLKKQRIKKVKKLKEEVEDDGVEDKPIVNNNSFTKEDLEEAQLQAILNYEKIRKSRKKEKQITMSKNKEEQDLRDKLTQAITPQKEYNPFNGCY
tara:strand:+ start:717 stop:1349 length:633 start_codon:yes stop_codon:yes gene_type:complete